MTSVQLSFMDVLFPDEFTQREPESATLGQPPPHRSITHRATVQPEVRVSTAMMRRYAGLEEIRPSEWTRYFPNTGKPWKVSDLQYLAEWWGKDDTVSLAYALGRPPWGLQREICKMRRRGTEIPYLRVDKPREDREMEYVR